jgi:hypothetical protein
MKTVRTSATHPLLIDAVPAPIGGGQIGMTFCPGKIDDAAMTGSWRRDLNADLDVVAEWQPDLILTLMERTSSICSVSRTLQKSWADDFRGGGIFQSLM